MISFRLNAIVGMVPKTQTVADIGCDHGKVAATLIKKQIAKSVICSDISGLSLDKARKLVKSRKIEDLVSFREGDGLDVLKTGEADVAVIAGMGGELIANILKNGKEKVPDILVLSCNTASGLLRAWLSSNGFVIEDEDLIYEGRHFYPVIKAKRAEPKTLSDIELEFGPILLEKKPKALKEFLKRRIEATKDIRKKMEKANKPNKEQLIGQIDEQLEKYREVEKCLRR